MSQFRNDEIIKFASEHGISYQEAWRTLIDSKAKTEKVKEDVGVKTKFCRHEDVSLPGNERGRVLSVYKAKSWTEPKYSVVISTGHVKTYTESDMEAAK